MIGDHSHHDHEGHKDQRGVDRRGLSPGRRRSAASRGAPQADVIDTVANQVVRFTVPLDVAMGNWVVLRVSDPIQPNPSPGPNGHPCNDFGLAYSSPWWLQPDEAAWHVSGISRTAGAAYRCPGNQPTGSGP